MATPQTVEALSGPMSLLKERRRETIRDAEAWSELWEAAKGSMAGDPPQVDFENEMVIVAAMGTRPSAGYGISIESVEVHEGELLVEVLEVSPGPTCILAQVITAPAVAVRVSKSDGPVRFVERAEVQECD